MALQKGKNVLFNIFLFYTKIKVPALKYGKQPSSTPHGNREFITDVLVTEEDWKLLKKKYKSVRAVTGAKEYDAEEFEARYKVSPPYEAETYYILKFKKSADFQDGNPTAPPLVKGTKKGQRITNQTELGNGTEAHLQWREREWTYEGKNGLSLDLAAIGVVELVEYVPNELEIEFDFEEDFDDDISDDDEIKGEASETPEEGSKEDDEDDWD